MGNVTGFFRGEKSRWVVIYFRSSMIVTRSCHREPGPAPFNSAWLWLLGDVVGGPGGEKQDGVRSVKGCWGFSPV